MKLYLVRHGCYSVDALSQLDSLTEKGRHDIESLATFIKPFAYSVAGILYSHKNRAKETADLIALGFQSDQPPLIHSGLNPDDDVDLMASEIEARGEDLVIVSHLPFLNKLTSLLLTGEAELDLIDFEAGMMVCLEKTNREKWLLHFILTPEWSTDPTDHHGGVPRCA